jgi:predicted alpha/beta-hydrolase family hydrolase
VIAKSFGTVVAARAFCEHHFRPQSAILIGTPFSAFDRKDLTSLQQLAEGVETLFIQQAEDPGGAASQIAASLGSSQTHVATVPGNDHHYTEVKALAAIIQEWGKRRHSECG